MNQFRIECSEVNYFTVLVEADTKEEAQELARANINSFDIGTSTPQNGLLRL